MQSTPSTRDAGPSQRELLRRSTILVVDDEPAIVRLLERMLERAGYVNVLGTSDPRAAVGLYRETPPDLVLLDLHMPELDGLAVIEALRAEDPCHSFVPIVAITGAASAETRLRALLLGAQDVLRKPIDYLDTMLRIRNLLEVRWLVRELQDERERARAG